MEYPLYHTTETADFKLATYSTYVSDLEEHCDLWEKTLTHTRTGVVYHEKAISMLRIPLIGKLIHLKIYQTAFIQNKTPKIQTTKADRIEPSNSAHQRNSISTREFTSPTNTSRSRALRAVK